MYMIMVMTKDFGLAICFYSTHIGFYPGALQDLWVRSGNTDAWEANKERVT